MASSVQSMRCKSDKVILERCMKTVKEMLHDRGYDTDRIGLLQRSDSEWTVQPFEWNEETHLSLVEYQLQSTEPLFIYPMDDSADSADGQSEEKKPVVTVIAYWKPFILQHDLFKEISFLFEKKEDEEPLITISGELGTIQWPSSHIMILTCSPLRTSDIRDLQPYQKKIRIETFHQGEIEFNRTHHELVPRHRKIPTHDVVPLLHHLNTSPHQCPKLLVNDIICRYYGGKVGDLFEIKRVDQTTGDMEITFRIVTST